MVKCEECRKVYRDDQVKCPQCGLEREIFDPPERKKGPGAQFREGEGLQGWAQVYCDEPRDAEFQRRYKALQDILAWQSGQVPGQRQNWASIWKRQKYL